MALISLISIVRKNFKNGSHFMEMEYHQKTGDGDAYFLFSEFSIGSFFPITHPRFHFNIYAWLHLKHVCVVYLMSHLCVVLHFLIFYNVERFKTFGATKWKRKLPTRGFKIFLGRNFFSKEY